MNLPASVYAAFQPLLASPPPGSPSRSSSRPQLRRYHPRRMSRQNSPRPVIEYQIPRSKRNNTKTSQLPPCRNHLVVPRYQRRPSRHPCPFYSSTYLLLLGKNGLFPSSFLLLLLQDLPHGFLGSILHTTPRSYRGCRRRFTLYQQNAVIS